LERALLVSVLPLQGELEGGFYFTITLS
jgi:hypothetical protein